MEEFKSFKSKEAIPPEDMSGDVNKEKKDNKSEFTKLNEQEAKKSKEEIERLMKRNEEIKKKLENLSN